MRVCCHHRKMKNGQTRGFKRKNKTQGASNTLFIYLSVRKIPLSSHHHKGLEGTPHLLEQSEVFTHVKLPL